jgi:3-oxoacyl-[acyl-carrier-protein] synthase II
MKKRIGVYGWGIVAPCAATVGEFAKHLEVAQSWLSPFEDYGPSNFQVGIPKFKFQEYKPWFDARFPSSKFLQIAEKMDTPSLYAIGAFIQSLEQNRGIETELDALGDKAHVYISTGYGNVDSQFRASVAVYEGQRQWDEFWSQPRVNSARRMHNVDNSCHKDANDLPGQDLSGSPDCADEAHFWAAKSPELKGYLTELSDIEGAVPLDTSSDDGKRRAFCERERSLAQLQRRVGAPDPPWRLSGNAFWNLHNTPAAQISIIGKIKGLSFAPVAACSGFAVALRLAATAINANEARVVVIGATDPAPHPLTLSAFYGARVLSASARISSPLTELRGAHVSGGAAVWIVGDFEYMQARGFKPIGLEPLAVGTSSDADHLVTPSTEGPQRAILHALAEAEVSPEDVCHWDLHATGTPGDLSEVRTLRTILPEHVILSARKATFGHGLAVAGGWELTAQYLGYELGKLFPTPLDTDKLNTHIKATHTRFVSCAQDTFPAGVVGKLSMGVGGVNACVISRPWGP